MPEEREVTIAEIIFHNEENGYTVAVVHNGTGEFAEEFVAVGCLPASSKGRTYVLTGSSIRHTENSLRSANSAR